jgi:hypothetical protein
MIRAISIIALAALASLLSGCGCSREKKPVDGLKERMSDVAYTNTLAKMREGQASAASRIAAITAKIENQGKDAESSPEYVALTNELAQCKAESEMIRKATRMAVRNRLMKDASKKGNLKK